MSDIIESRTIEIADISYRINITPDYDIRPEGDGSWTKPDDIAAWKRDDWRYVGVIVTPIISGEEISTCETSLWGVVYGTLGDGTEIDMDTICDNADIVPSLISEINGLLGEFATKLTEALARFTPNS